MKKWILGILLCAGSLIGLAGLALAFLVPLWPVDFFLSPDAACLGRLYPVPDRKAFLCELSDLKTGRSTRFTVMAWYMGGASHSWSDTHPPNLAVITGGDEILLQAEKAGGWESKILPVRGCNFIRWVKWAPGGRGLAFAVSLEGGLTELRCWREGMPEPSRIPITAKGLKITACFLSEDRILVADSGREPRTRFWLVDPGKPTEPREVTESLPPLSQVTWLASCPNDPELLLIRSKGDAPFRLARFGAPGKVTDLERAWDPVFSRDGKALFFRKTDRKEKADFLCQMNLADGAVTQFGRIPWEKGLNDLPIHPQGKWAGVWGRRSLGIPFAEAFSRTIRDAKAPGTVRLGYTSRLKQLLYNLNSPAPWYGTPSRYELGDLRLGLFFPEAQLFDPLTGQVRSLPRVLNWGALRTLGSGLIGFFLLTFLVNTGLFAVLTFGRSASPGARPLGLVFWCLSWLSPMFLMFPFAQLSIVDIYGPAMVLALLLTVCVTALGLFWLPYSTLRFATEFPVPNAFKVRFPKSVKAAKAITTIFPAIATLAVLFATVQAWRDWQSGGVVKTGEGIKAAAALLETLFGVGGVLGFIILVLSLAAIAHNFRFAPDPRTKGQLRYIALGFIVSTVWHILGWILVPLLMHFMFIGFVEVFLFWFGPVLLIPGLFCGYALLSKELMDVSFVVRRTVKYTLVIGALGLIFVGVVASLGVLLPAVFGARSEVAVALATAAVVLAFQPLRRGVQGWVDKRFDRARYDARKTLSDLTARFSTMGSVEEVRATLEGAAKEITRVGQSRLLFFRGGRIGAASAAVPESLELADLSGLDPKEIQGLLSVDLPWVKLAIPVGHGRQAFALLALGEKLSQEKFSPEDREFLKILADGAGLALKNLALVREAAKSEVLKRDLEAAREVQARYFPRELPAIPGFAVSAHNEPARIVGGDFYDVLALGGSLTAFAIADVSGKGMPAALRVSEVRTFLHTILPADRDPGSVLTQMNRYLCGSGHKNEFTTAFLCVLDPASGRLACALAGHIPPLLKAGGSARPIRSAGTLPLGIDPQETYESWTFTLEPGALLVMMSDGLPERKDPRGALLGFEAVERALADAAPGNSPEEVVDLLRALGEAFARGEPAEDDATVVVLKRGDGGTP